MSPPERDPITHKFIGLAMKVHSAVGPGLSEEIYHQELAAALIADGVEHLSKPKRALLYRGIVVDTFEPDFVIENHFIPELKCLQGSFAKKHMVQVFCYCKFWQLRTSLLTDFGKQSLNWVRLLYRSQAAMFAERTPPANIATSLADRIVHVVSDCLDEIGLGYRQTTWKALVNAALQMSGHNVQVDPPAVVLDRHNISVPCLIVDHTCAIHVTALNDGISATDRAVLQTQLRWLNLDWGIVFHFGKATADLSFVCRPKGSPSDSRRTAD